MSPDRGRLSADRDNRVTLWEPRTVSVLLMSEAAHEQPGGDPIGRELRADAAASRERILATVAGELIEGSSAA
jgi:hypothetical protein